MKAYDDLGSDEPGRLRKAASMRLYCDTTVLLNAAGAGHDTATSAACRTLVRGFAGNVLAGEISTEVLQELLHTAAWRQARSQGIELVELTARIFPHPLPVAGAMVVAAAGLLREHPRLGTRVAIHAAVMLAAGIGDVISTDPEFGLISGVRRRSPVDAVRDFRLPADH